MKEKTICRGDLFYYDFGTRTGSIQSGTRPVLVIQADDYNRRQEKIQTYEELLCRETEIKEQEKALKNQKYSTDFLQENEVYLKYRSLKERLKEIPESEDEFEKVLDELEELEQNLPDAVLNGKTFNEQEQIEQKLQILREEKRIIRHIKREETEDQFFSTPLQPIERSKDKKKEVQEQWVKAR